MMPAFLPKRDHDNPHRHSRLACTDATVAVRAVTLEGATEIVTYACAACGQTWDVPKPASTSSLVERREFEF